jgi:cyclase
MLYPRIIPCLLVHKRGLVKTVKFRDSKYVGDPINAVKIFNEKEVDEIVVLDIDATVENHEPDYKMIENIAIECRMPLCYGGGIKTVQQAKRIFGLGVEKIALSSAAIENPGLVSQIAKEVGNQSVIIILDVKRHSKGNRYDIWTNNATINSEKDPIEFAMEMEKSGAGEIVLNSIDNDGMMTGYDLQIIDKIRDSIRLPLSVLGGAGNLEDIGQLINRYGIIGAAAGSLFVFKGKYKAVLINYPSRLEKYALINAHYRTK